jgi:hypothetical protein
MPFPVFHSIFSESFHLNHKMAAFSTFTDFRTQFTASTTLIQSSGALGYSILVAGGSICFLIKITYTDVRAASNGICNQTDHGIRGGGVRDVYVGVDGVGGGWVESARGSAGDK